MGEWRGDCRNPETGGIRAENSASVLQPFELAELRTTGVVSTIDSLDGYVHYNRLRQETLHSELTARIRNCFLQSFVRHL